MALPYDSFAQKRKKPASEPTATGVKAREAEFYFTEGEKFFILEDYAKALAYYQRVLEIDPQNATIHYKIAEVLARSGKQDDILRAALSIENSLRLEKGNKFFYLLAVNIYNSLTQFEKAAQTYETLLKEIKGTEEHLYDLAAVYQYANKPDDAVKAYNRAESIFGISEVSSLEKSKIFLQQNKVKEAIAEGEKLMRTYPGEERYIMSFTEMLSQKGLSNEAITYLEKFLSSNPDASDSKMLLAGFYREGKQELKARPLLLTLFDDPEVELNSKLIMISTYNMELREDKTKNTIDIEKGAFVESLLQKLAKHYPHEGKVHVIGGDYYLMTNKRDKAQQEYVKALEAGEVNYEVWENILHIDVQTEAWDDAVAHAEEALELFPNHSMIHYFNGLAQLRMQQHPDAIAALEQAKRLASSNRELESEINLLLGEAYYATKQFDKSDKVFEEVLAANPAHTVALNNYSYNLATRKFNLEKAERMAEQLVKSNAPNANFLDTYAQVLYAKGKFKEALKVTEQAIAISKNNATHLEHLGDILFQLGRVDEAVQQWEKASVLNANNEMLNRKIANRKIYE